MPALVYTSSNFPFVAFSKIFSADVNSNFNDIKTLLNTTGLTSTNVQAHGLTRTTSASNIAAGTANSVVINDANGDFSDEPQLAPSRGGTGINVVPGSQTAGDVLQINSGLTGFTLGPPTSVPAALKLFQYTNFI